MEALVANPPWPGPGYGAPSDWADIVHDGVDTRVYYCQEAADLRSTYAPGADQARIFHGVIDLKDGPELLVEAAPTIQEQHPKWARNLPRRSETRWSKDGQ